MRELARRRYRFIQILIRRMFADRDELRFICRNVQIENGPAIRRPEDRTERAIRRGLQTPVLPTIEVDEPQRFIEVLTDFLDTTEAADVAPERWRELLQKGG